MDKLPEWEKFEILVADVQKTLAPQASVNKNEKIYGKRSNTYRKIDIVVRQKVGQDEKSAGEESEL